MLERLVIKNFAIIEDIEVSFNNGMNCIVGETGAGKSIIIDALSLLKGEKSKFDKIRHGENKASIDGTFYIDDLDLIREINDEYDDLIEEDGLLYVSRTLDIASKSICKINYRSVPISVLKKIMEQIIDIHSQHKDNSFFDEKKQIQFLDDYSNRINDKEIVKLVSKYESGIYSYYSKVYKEYLKEVDKLNELQEKQKSFEDLEVLQYQFDELDKANIQENEIEDIEEELRNLESFQSLSNSIEEVKENYNELNSLLYSTKRALNSIKSDMFNEEIERFNETYYEISDVFEQITSKYDKLYSSSYRLEELRERKSVLYGLRRKYGRSTEEILNYFASIKEEIELITNFDYIIEKQKDTISNLINNLDKIASDLTKIRMISSSYLEKVVNEQLKDLLLENSDFKIEINESSLNKHGKDQVRFILRANAGGKYLSLASTASLGETSRINLALKTVFNNIKPVGTMIFDEIDTGISGKVAVGVSKKIHAISSLSQTIVITHLPQVSAIGDHHYFVSKYVENDSTKTKIHKLEENEVISNIAYMMTGEEPSEESLTLAKQLVKSIK